MNEPASAVIAARARGQGTLTPMLVWSVAAHIAIVAAIWLAPASTANQTPRTVMTINLAGAPGPRAGGLTQTGGRAVPERLPEPPKPVPRTPPPAPAQQAATLPSPKAAPARPARSEPAPAAPSVPEPPREGNTRVETGARGQGFGLATGGTGQKGIELEVTNFCCPGYLVGTHARHDRRHHGALSNPARGHVRFGEHRAVERQPHARRGGGARHLARTDPAAVTE